MIRDRRSATAAGVAIARAMEHMRAPGDRILEDPYAIAFAQGDPRRFAVTSGPLRRLALRVFERLMPGTVELVAARGRYADGLVTARAGAGCDQLVVLGAGFDTASLRLAPHLPGVTIFEVDHPATQATKRRRIRAHVRPAESAHVRFVPVDLMRDDLADALRRAGFATDERAVVVWEGVTNYLTADAVDTTLRHLAGLIARGGRLVVTYIDRSALDGTGGFSGVEEWHAAVRRHGESWTFGFDPVELPGYLAERGMTLTQDVSTRDAAARYLGPLGRDEPTAPFYRIACAEFSQDAA